MKLIEIIWNSQKRVKCKVNTQFLLKKKKKGILDGLGLDLLVYFLKYICICIYMHLNRYESVFTYILREPLLVPWGQLGHTWKSCDTREWREPCDIGEITKGLLHARSVHHYWVISPACYYICVYMYVYNESRNPVISSMVMYCVGYT